MEEESEKYRHYNDERRQAEVQLTNILIDTVSGYNIQLHQQTDYPCTHANKDVLTIAINGVPANRQEFEGFTFTKRFVNYFPPCFELDRSEEFYAQRIRDAKLEIVVREIDDIVASHGNRVVLASHSFGSYISTAYIHHHPDKVVGIIEFGCIPITFYSAIKTFGSRYIFGGGDLSLGTLLKNKDSIFQDYMGWVAGIDGLLPMNIYTLIAFYSILNAEVFREMFAWRRNYPDILKLVIFGRQDRIFEVHLLNEMAYHYTYGAGSLSEGSNKKIRERYKAATNFEAANVQERFVYSIPKAGHGLHIKRKKPLQNLMNLYLSLVLSDFP